MGGPPRVLGRRVAVTAHNPAGLDPVGDPDRVAHAAVLRPLAVEALDLGSTDVAGRACDPGPGLVQTSTDVLLHRLQVQERNGEHRTVR